MKSEFAHINRVTDKVTIIDKPCGFGKSSTLIKEIKDNPDKPYLIIVPLLSEIKRFTDAIPHLTEPDLSDSDSKFDHLQTLLIDGESIITTHALFNRVRELDHLLHQYHIIIDEMPSVICGAEIKHCGKATVDVLLKEEYIKLGKANKVTITNKGLQLLLRNRDDKNKDTVSVALNYVMTNETYLDSGSIFITLAPEELFTSSKSTKILTFLFEGSYLQGYLDYKEIEYIHEVDKAERKIFKKQMNKHLTIIKPFKELSCSYSKLNKLRPSKMKPILQEHLGISDDKSIVVTTKEYESIILESNTIADGDADYSELIKDADINIWLPNVTRGTNDYIAYSSMIYLYKQSLNPVLKRHLGMTDKMNLQYRVSEMIQVIYRGCIRKSYDDVTCDTEKDMKFITPDSDSYEALLMYLGRKQELEEWRSRNDNTDDWTKLSAQQRKDIQRALVKFNDKVKVGGTLTPKQKGKAVKWINFVGGIDNLEQYLKANS